MNRPRTKQLRDYHICNTTSELVFYGGDNNSIILPDNRFFYYDSASSAAIDNLTVFAATGKGSGRWLLLLDTTYTPAGLILNDSSSPAITTNNAILTAAFAVAASTKGTILLLPKGTIYYSTPLVTPSGFTGIIGTSLTLSNLRYTGTGWGLTITNGCVYREFQLSASRTGERHGIRFSGHGTSPSSNGDGCAWMNVANVRASGFNGGGLVVDTVFDSSFYGLSTEECGNASSYAFWVGSSVDGDTSNMSSFVKLQVELSHNKAIFVDPNTLCCHFTNIHSERSYGDNSSLTWQLGGAQCTYTNVRLHAQTDSHAKALLSTNGGSFTDLRIESGVDRTELENSAGQPPLSINGLTVSGELGEKASQSGKIVVTNGAITTLSTQMGNAPAYRHCTIGTLNVGFCSADSNALELERCTVGTVTSSNSSSCLVARQSTINAGVFAETFTRLIDTTFTAGTYTIGYRRAELIHSNLVGTITIDTAYVVFLNGSHITGNLTVSSNRQVIFDDSSYVTGSVSGFGAPQAEQYAGGFVRGQRTWNPAPATGQPSFWECTSSYVAPSTASVWVARTFS